MVQLTLALSAWGTPEFENVLKAEIEQLGVDQLPLQQGLSTSSYALDSSLKARIIKVSDDANCISAKVGLFYTGVIAGCNCADDPTPVEEQNEYCEVRLDINKSTAGMTVTLLPE